MDEVEYTGLVAEAWDALRGDTSGWEDRAFYLDLIAERGEPVLDVGCGTGRLLLDYLALGIDVDGVDNSEEMLARCRANAARLGLGQRLEGRLHHQSMEALDLARRYRTIVVPSSSFQLVLDPAAARSALHRFHAHLVPGGTLAMPFIVMDAAYDETRVREADLGDGSVVRRTARAWYDPATQFEHTDDRYEVLRGGEVVRAERKVRSPATRAYRREQLEALYEDAGFLDLEWCSGFTRAPAAAEDEVLTVLARRPT